MTTQKGFNGWIQIFKGGNQTDSGGHTHDGDELIAKALAGFNTKEHEPPAVVGHPQDNAPAFAWVDDLKEEIVDGKRVLMAKFKQVVPEFEKMVKKGLFKKRSAAFYPDGRLRHVGFLGAAPPAVKGLADIGFACDLQVKEDDLVTFEFGENTAGRQVYEQAMVIMKEKYPKDSDSELHNGLQFNEAFSKSVEIVRINEPTLFEKYLNEI